MDFVTVILALFGNVDGSMIEKIVGGVVVYLVARREVRKQFGSLNDHLARIEAALQIFGQKIIDLETKHDSRLVKLETTMELIKHDVTEIKIKAHNGHAKEN